MTADGRAIVVKWFARVLLKDALRELADEAAAAADDEPRDRPAGADGARGEP